MLPHILLAVSGEDRHVYAIIQDVAARTGGALRLGAGTLYRSIARMVEQELLAETSERRELDDDQFYDRVLSDVRALPGVHGAAYITGLPMVVTGRITDVVIPGREVSATFRDETASVRFVTPRSFETMGIPLLRGRDVAEGDVQGRALVAVVSESFTRHDWPDQDPIGRTFEARGETRTLVGVVGDVKVRGLERVSEPQLYLPAAQVPDAAFVNDDPQDLVVRATGTAGALIAAVRQIVRAADPEQPISDVRTLEDVVAGETATRRAQLRILGALAAIALLLSAIGVYGLLAYTVSQRSREIGVRLALGAEPRGVARMVVWQRVKLALVGMVPGALAAYRAARGMRALLFGVEPADPPTFLIRRPGRRGTRRRPGRSPAGRRGTRRPGRRSRARP